MAKIERVSPRVCVKIERASSCKKIERDSTGKYPAYAWPGGYPIFYLTREDELLCASCASALDGNEAPAAHGIYWEGQPIGCDNCSAEIESAYGDPEEPEEKPGKEELGGEDQE